MKISKLVTKETYIDDLSLHTSIVTYLKIKLSAVFDKGYGVYVSGLGGRKVKHLMMPVFREVVFDNTRLGNSATEVMQVLTSKFPEDSISSIL